MIRDQYSDHVVCKLLRKKGYTRFEVYNSAIKNWDQGWWVESEQLPYGCQSFLGCRLPDALHTLKNTDQIPKRYPYYG